MIETDLYPSGRLLESSGISRERMVSFRATSAPEKSSAGCGSVYPSSLATRTTEENDRSAPLTGENSLKM